MAKSSDGSRLRTSRRIESAGMLLLIVLIAALLAFIFGILSMPDGNV
jgi:hypothetical protein